MKESEKARLIGYLYLGSWPFFFVLSKLRNNMEFVFFYGMIDALVVIQFSKYLKIKPLTWIFPIATFITMLSGFYLFPEGITLLFPFIALILVTVFQYFYSKIYHKEPVPDLLFTKGSSKGYTLLLSVINFTIWISLILQFSFQHVRH